MKKRLSVINILKGTEKPEGTAFAWYFISQVPTVQVSSGNVIIALLSQKNLSFTDIKETTANTPKV